jgi:Arc/MetJ-type ribon-helix-helix transcriptional regulator
MPKVMISLPEAFLRQVDRVARAQNRSRSELVREALRTAIVRHKRSRAWRDALAPLRDLESQWVGQWDSTDVIRYYRDLRHGREDRR